MRLKKISPLVVLILAACATAAPKVIQTVPGSPELRLIAGMATQVEMPDNERVQSVTVGNPSLVSAEQSGEVVNLQAKGNAGETNMIVRATDDGGKAKVYQYHITVSDR